MDFIPPEAKEFVPPEAEAFVPPEASEFVPLEASNLGEVTKRVLPPETSISATPYDIQLNDVAPSAMYSSASPTADLALAAQGVKSVGTAALHPIQTAKTLANIGRGVYEVAKEVPMAVKGLGTVASDLLNAVPELPTSGMWNALTKEKATSKFSEVAARAINEIKNAAFKTKAPVTDVIPDIQKEFTVELPSDRGVPKFAATNREGQILSGHRTIAQTLAEVQSATPEEKVAAREAYAKAAGYIDKEGVFFPVEDVPFSDISAPVVNVKSGQVLRTEPTVASPALQEEQLLLDLKKAKFKGFTEPITIPPALPSPISVKTPIQEVIDSWSGTKSVVANDAKELGASIRGAVSEGRTPIIDSIVKTGKAPTVEEYKDAINKLRTVAVTASKDEAATALKHADALEKALLESPAKNGVLQLHPEEKEIVQQVQAFYDESLKASKQIGTIKGEIEGYTGPEMYYPSKVKDIQSQGRLSNTPFARERTEGTILEKISEGRTPRTLDLGDQMQVYHLSTGNAIANKAMVLGVKDSGLINYSGKGVRIQSPTFRVAFNTDKGVIVKDAYATPEVAKAINNLTTPGFMSRHPWLQKIQDYSQWQKMWTLTLSAFHFKALAVESIGKGMSPFSFVEGLDLAKTSPEIYRNMLRAGLTSGDARTFGGALTDIALPTASKGVLSDLKQIFDTALWDRVYKGYKIMNTNNVMVRNINRGIEPTRALELATADSNASFGGLNLEKIGRNKETQEAFRFLALSPDWTESKIRQVIMLTGRGTGAITPQEVRAVQQEARATWARIGVYLVAQSIVDQVAPGILPGMKETGVRDVTKLLTSPDRYVTGKMSPVGKSVFDFLTGNKLRALTTDQIPVPIGISQVAKTAASLFMPSSEKQGK